MAYFRRLEDELESLLALTRKSERWLILINADPDALGSAMALKRILARRAADVGIAQINEIKRPDNLAMIKYLRIPSRQLTPELAERYDRFALVDSQPHHNPEFAPFDFSVVIDHHPLRPDKPVKARYVEILPEYGATATILTEYLYNLDIRPAKLLATALMYGIKADTQSFERPFQDVDLRAFRYLAKFADQFLLRRIARSEFRQEWLTFVAQAIERKRTVGRGGHGTYVWMGAVDNPDILVILADFLLRVHGVHWTVVAGTHDGKAVTIFRGDGLRREMGRMATRIFDGLGSAGGHKTMARAEIPLDKFKCETADHYLWRKISTHDETFDLNKNCPAPRPDQPDNRPAEPSRPSEHPIP